MKRWLKKYQVELLLYLSFVVFHTVLLFVAKTPLMYGDERGYIGWARKIVYGISDGGRYLPGYSFFLLPVLKITNRISVAYPLILTVNGLIGGWLPVGAYRLSETFGLSKKERLLCAGICGMYPAYLLYANMALCEILLASLFMLYFLLCSRIAQNPSRRITWFGLLFTVGLLLMTHTRTLIVLPALAVSIPVLVSRKQRTKAMIGVGAALVAGVLGGILFFSKQNTNTVHLQTQIAGLLTGRGIKDLCYAVCSQCSYLLCSTFFIGEIGIWNGIRMIWKKEDGWQTVWCMLSSWFFLFFLSCLYMSHHEKPVHIIYGRYNDCLTFVLLLLGTTALMKQKKIPKRLIVPVAFVILITGWKQASLLGNGNEGAFLARISAGSVDSELAQVFGIGLYRMVLEQFDYWQMVLLFVLFTGIVYCFYKRSRQFGIMAVVFLFFLSVCYTDWTYFYDWTSVRKQPSEVTRILNGDEQIKVVEQEENGLGYAWDYDHYMTCCPELSISREECGQGLLLTRQTGYDLPLLAVEKNVNLYLWARNEQAAETYRDFIINSGEETAELTVSSDGTVTLTATGAPLLCYEATYNIRKCAAVIAVWYDRAGEVLYSERLELPGNLYRGESTEWILIPPEEAERVFLGTAKEYDKWLGEGKMYQVREKEGRSVFEPIDLEADAETLSFQRIEMSHLKEGYDIQNTTWTTNLSGFCNGLAGAESRITNISCPVQGKSELVIYSESGKRLEVEINGISAGSAEWENGCYRFQLDTDTVTEITIHYPVVWKTSNIKLLNRWYQSRYDGLRITKIAME